MLIILSFNRSSLKSCLLIMFDKAIFDADAIDDTWLRNFINFYIIFSGVSFLMLLVPVALFLLLESRSHVDLLW